MESLFAEVGDRRQETGDRRRTTPRPSPSQEGKSGEMGMSEEVGVRIVRMIFLLNSCLKY
ncbi:MULTISPECIES: hypothetical protein [Okeania]|uniref:hypothetical protein n=1 Tax=Okeania TaxID=1458928 RepID=UPI000F524813|nr:MULTISPECIES: hypothetical protein [Okeania]NES74502.1 hypothetical protein [Okeania sp. SIO1H4]NES89837.1 hypothetical protein [Okeania sp. SIO2B9]NET20894.1 hypothetical protein [Okeania sp. SIO1H5]NET75789.1 hypothetical protein [Okeania sp. SIO1F9]NET94037.1 hypothetical protein [Okeania sp. SIO1H2]